MLTICQLLFCIQNKGLSFPCQTNYLLFYIMSVLVTAGRTRSSDIGIKISGKWMRVSPTVFRKKIFCPYKNLVNCCITYINWYVLVTDIKIAYWTISMISVWTVLIEMCYSACHNDFFSRNFPREKYKPFFSTQF